MTTHDDRSEFEANKAELCRRLGGDRETLDRATEFFVHMNGFDYSYLWSWLGVPIIQIPPDIVATQEVIWNTRPDVIVETGVARGGSLVFMASILAATGRRDGKVIGIDIDIRAHNRDTIESHPLASYITLIEGGSTDPEVIRKVREAIPAGARVMVVLDSDHSRDHVLAECRAYGDLVSDGCYLIVADTVVGHLHEGQSITRSKTWTPGDDPLTAARLFLAERDDFVVDPVINGKLVFSSSHGGYLLKQTR
ncbi:cephalosporin hydroxylase [Siculibacillus lacustris]|uniref:Cephalosporin hydroxylase n=1 Tax=Siculibacillus lacustris TaxID=1549641 RepID=A0A4Q9VRA0_9HYPH|nr:CmcI family methyltransferase [Siculibacillus lacustris]TBW38273.1 cephalosporin hydroxylase [Siculibacillus lacustris]